jgi:hypothetical protein
MLKDAEDRYETIFTMWLVGMGWRLHPFEYTITLACYPEWFAQVGGAS